MIEVGDGGGEQVGAVTEGAKAGVALATEKGADLVAGVTVIDAEAVPLIGRLFADGTNPTLPLEHGVVVGDRDAIIDAQLMSPLFNGITRPRPYFFKAAPSSPPFISNAPPHLNGTTSLADPGLCNLIDTRDEMLPRLDQSQLGFSAIFHSLVAAPNAISTPVLARFGHSDANAASFAGAGLCGFVHTRNAMLLDPRFVPWRFAPICEGATPVRSADAASRAIYPPGDDHVATQTAGGGPLFKVNIGEPMSLCRQCFVVNFHRPPNSLGTYVRQEQNWRLGQKEAGEFPPRRHNVFRLPNDRLEKF